MQERTDVLKLLRAARKLAKTAAVDKADLKIAVIGSFSIQYFVLLLRYLLKENGIAADIYEGEYNSIAMDALNPESELFAFDPDLVIGLPHYTDIRLFPELFSAEDERDALLEGEAKKQIRIWKALSAGRERHILWANYAFPLENELGSLEKQYPFSKTSYYSAVNAMLQAERPENVCIIDLEGLACYFGKQNWFDYSAYFLSKTGFKTEYLKAVCDVFVRHILAVRGRTKKCLVLDLDNTLWGGVVGDDGADGIILDPNNALGEAYRYFQSYVLALKRRGVILAVCSKNEEHIAKEPFTENKNMIIRLDDISCFVANWNDKVGNIRAIAKQLNIGIDSLVFFDDNPAEREIVAKYLPEVTVIEVPEDPADYVKVLAAASPFDWLQLTREDILRSDSYIANRKRIELESSVVNYEEYLRALEMRGGVYRLETSNVARFAQLINKTNQFNLRTQRYTEAQVSEMISDSSKVCLYSTLSDCFSEYGVISCVILEKSGKSGFIDSWVMSCRVLKRGVEHMTMESIISEAKKMGCEEIRGQYLKTAKNSLVKNLLDEMGFECVEDLGDRKEYLLPLSYAEAKHHQIKKENQ